MPKRYTFVGPYPEESRPEASSWGFIVIIFIDGSGSRVGVCKSDVEGAGIDFLFLLWSLPGFRFLSICLSFPTSSLPFLVHVVLGPCLC
jgi:hypothetical protein